ncbi:MAG: ABC transporter permease [Verrucomicrobiia bacterium]
MDVVNSSSKKNPLRQLVLPWEIARHLYRYKTLIYELTKRDIAVRYRGSYLGIFWSFLRPLCMLCVFGVVFGYIFQSKLGRFPHESKVDFALALFSGLIIFDMFGECLGRAPTLILSNANYVTKVVFPLEILPVSVVVAAFCHLLISLVPLLIGVAIAHGSVPLTTLYVPVILVPVVLLCLGTTWFFASLGVFFRDINSFVPVLLTILMYASAIFYSVDSVPPAFRPIVLVNPLAILIHQWRSAIMWRVPIDWARYGVHFAGCAVFMIVSYIIFMRTKSAFADVL